MQTTPQRAPRRALTRLTALVGAAIAAIALSLAAASPALAHDQLVGTSVEADADTGAATAVVLSFNNEVLDVGTEIHVTGPDGSDATGGDPAVSGRDVIQALAAPLSAGEYAIAWRVASSDGHPIQGELALRIAEDGSGTISGLEDGAEHDHDHGDEDEAHDHGDEAHDHADGHEHSDDAAVTTENIAAGPSAATITLIVVVALAAVAAIAVLIVGLNRRKRTIEGGRPDADR